MWENWKGGGLEKIKGKFKGKKGGGEARMVWVSEVESKGK